MARTTTVAIPVYNGEPFVDEAVSSVLDQTEAPTRVLVLDNCSTDRTREVVRSLLPAGGLLEAERNVGAVANFNRAVAESDSTYFAWLGADDRLLPRFVEVTAAILDADPAVDACLPAVRFIDRAGRPTGHVQRDPELASADVRTRLRSYLRRPRWTEVYCLYRRDLLLASPRFQPEYGADVLLTWWFLLRAPLVVIDEPLVEYRTYPVKSADATAEGLNPTPVRRRWLMTTLWRSLWRQAGEAGVDAGVRRIARRELVRCLWHRQWVKHLVWDVYLVAGDVVPANLVHRLRHRLAPPR